MSDNVILINKKHKHSCYDYSFFIEKIHKISAKAIIKCVLARQKRNINSLIFSCGPHEFTCGDVNNTCIAPHLFCDGIIDCPNGADERIYSIHNYHLGIPCLTMTITTNGTELRY